MTSRSSEPDPEEVPADGGARAADEAGPGGLLGDLRRLRRDARITRHAYWFPLVLFGLLIGASAPFYIQPAPRNGVFTRGGVYLPAFGGFLTSGWQGYLAVYWLVSILAGLALTWVWYRGHGRRVGLMTPSRGYLITGLVLVLIALLLPLAGPVPVPGDLIVRGTFPFVIIALGLWVLARAERSWALLAIAAVFTAAALLASLYNIENILFRLGWNPTSSQWRLTSLPNVLLPALVLLVAGAAAYFAQRRQLRRAA